MKASAPLALLVAAALAAPAVAATAPRVRIASIDELAKPLPLPYDEAADADAAVAAARARARAGGKRLLIDLGGNWCGDCRALDTALKSPANAEMINKEFVVVKVDVGNFDRHLDIAERYGNAIKRGIPAAAVLSPQQTLLYTTKGGELANARKMSDTGVYDFFRGVVASAKTATPAK